MPETKPVGKHGRSNFERRTARLVEQPLETIRIDLFRLDRQAIAAPNGLQERGRLALSPARLELFSQPRHEPLDDRAGGRRRVLSPELVDEPLRRDGLAGVKDEQSEEHTATSRRQVDASSPVEDLHRPQDPELHPSLPAAWIDRSTRLVAARSGAFSGSLAARRRV